MSPRRAGVLVAATILASCAALPVRGLTVEIGATAGGGLVFAYGSFLDAKAESLAELGASTMTAVGSSAAEAYGDWIGGAWVDLRILAWLSVRGEFDVESAGALRTALTSSGSPFDVHGLSFASISVPVLARAWLTLGPGEMSFSLGPYLGVVTGDITVVDRYATATTVATITPDFWHRFYFGLVGGFGYVIPLGPVHVGAEARVDWAILGATVSDGLGNGGINPIGVNLVLTCGFAVGKGSS